MADQPFVARERELQQLNHFLDGALAGQGQVCFVTGEAGAGKTALVTEFARRAQAVQPDLLVAMGNCNAQTGIGDPYLPFREVLGLLTGDVEAKLAQDAITQENAKRLRAFLVRSGQILIEVAPDLVDVLVPGSHLIALVGTAMAEKLGWVDELENLVQRRQERPAGAETMLEQSRLFEQYTNVLMALAAEQPLIVMLDDLQWADKASISLLFHLSRSVGESRILIVGAYRPAEVELGRRGERHPLEPVINELQRYFGDIWIDLDQTAPAEGRQFVDAFLDTQPNRLGESFRQALFQRTEGRPLFTVELLRNMQERGDLVRDVAGYWAEGSVLNWDDLPARVEGVIEERIERLEAGLREILSVASVEGVDFTVEVIARLQEMSERQLVRRLSQELDKQHRLVREKGVERVGPQRLSLYRFRHILIQKYLYNNLGQTERRFLHEDVGHVLEELYGDQAGEIAVQLARHFEEAGIAEQAVDYLLQAGQRAIRLSANAEAIGHLTRGLELLRTLPESSERAQQELDFLTTLGPALITTRGYAAPEVEQTYARARELCRQLGDTLQLFPVLWSLVAFHQVRSEMQKALELAERCLGLAQQVQDPTLLMMAHSSIGSTLYLCGQFVPAREHLEEAVARYDTQQHHSLTYLYAGQDPGVVCLCFAAVDLWSLGYPDQALKRIGEALALAQELDHPYTMVYALYFAAQLHQLFQDVEATQEQLKYLLPLATKHGFGFALVLGTILRGWGMMAQAQETEGIAQIQQAMAAYEPTGAHVFRPYFLTLLAEAHGKQGQAEQGLTVLAEAQSAVDESGERWWEPEVHRLRGELLQIQGEADAEGEACFRQAIEVARRQQAKSLELRATMSLCQLWQQQGRGAEGRQMLAEVYNWFTEGLDTPDLIEAKELLEDLSS